MKKRMLSIVVSLCLVFAPLLSLAGFAFDNADCPYVFVHGFMASDIYYDVNDKSKGVAWPPTTDAILTAVKDALPSLSDLLIKKDYEAFFAKAFDPIKAMLDTANLGPDGTIIDSTGIIWEYPAADTITKSSYVSFRYDWRLSPIVIAEQLNDFIEYVCQCSGSDKVCLEGHSFGGIVLNTYTKLYGTGRIKSAIYNTTAVYGETYNGELMTGQITINAEALVAFLGELVGSTQISDLLNSIFDLIYATGLVDDTADLANELLKVAPNEVYTEIVLPMFAGWLSIWAMIPDEYVETAKYYVFTKLYADNGENHKGLIEQIDEYDTLIRPYKTETLLKTNEDCNLYIISRYGSPSIPITPSWQILSDNVIDTQLSSMGAKCCEYGKRFSDNFLKENADNPYISPTGQIDASTCLFPEQTWFIRSLEHSACCDTLDEMFLELAYYNGQATVDTFEQYPRYMEYLSDEDAVQPDSFTFEEKEKTFFEKIIDFFKNLFKQFVLLLKLFK